MQRGFTLIEVLVVVVIIALLTAILMPSMARARESSRGVVCSSNLRQISIGWAMYAEQYRGAMVAGRMPNLSTADNPRANLYFVGNGFKFRPRWYAMLGVQVRLFAFKKPSELPAEDNTQGVDGEVFLDPSVPERRSARNYPYGYNFQFLGNSRLKTNRIDNSDYIRWPVKTEAIRATARTVMAADCLGTAASFAVGDRLPYDATGTKTAAADLARMNNHAWSLDPPRLTGTSDSCDDGNRGKARSAPDPRHMQKANAFFADGHMERRTPRELGYTVQEDGSVPLKGAGSNHLFSGTGQDRDPPPILR